MGKYFNMKTFIAIIAPTLALSSIIAKRNVVKDTATLNTPATAFPNAQIKNDTAQRAHGKKPARANAKKTLTAAQRKDRDAKRAAWKTKRAERKAARQAKIAKEEKKFTPAQKKTAKAKRDARRDARRAARKAKIAKRKAAEKDFTPAQKKAARAARKSARATKRAAAKAKKAAKKPARALGGRPRMSAADAPVAKVVKEKGTGFGPCRGLYKFTKRCKEYIAEAKARATANPLTQAGVWSSGDAMDKDIKRKIAEKNSKK